jgi:hypothetical protein
MNQLPDLDTRTLEARESINASRAAIADFFRQESVDEHRESDRSQSRESHEPRGNEASTSLLDGVADVIKRAAATHPAAVVAQSVAPLVRAQIRAKPWHALGLAAGLGAVVVVTRPWKRLVLTSLVAGVLQPATVKSLVTQGIARFAEGLDHNESFINSLSSRRRYK